MWTDIYHIVLFICYICLMFLIGLKCLFHMIFYNRVMCCSQVCPCLCGKLFDTLVLGVNWHWDTYPWHIPLIELEGCKPSCRAHVRIHGKFYHGAFIFPVLLVIPDYCAEDLSDRSIRLFSTSIHLRMECSRH